MANPHDVSVVRLRRGRRRSAHRRASCRRDSPFFGASDLTSKRARDSLEADRVGRRRSADGDGSQRHETTMWPARVDVERDVEREARIDGHELTGRRSCSAVGAPSRRAVDGVDDPLSVMRRERRRNAGEVAAGYGQVMRRRRASPTRKSVAGFGEQIDESCMRGVDAKDTDALRHSSSDWRRLTSTISISSFATTFGASAKRRNAEHS